MEAIKPSENSEIIGLKAVENSNWPSISPLPKAVLPPVQKFCEEWLPSGTRAHVLDFTQRSGCPIEYLGITVIIEMAALIGCKYAIHPKQYDDWLVVPNLWGAVIGRPSAMKSPAIQAMLKPLKQIEKIEKELYQQALDKYHVQIAIDKTEEDAVKQKLKKAFSSDKPISVEAIKTQLFNLQEQRTKEPKRKRLIVNDTTVEKLGEILNENENGVLVYRDELIGLLNSLERHDRSHEKAFYLECFNGSGDYTFDRVARGSVFIESTTISMLGGITPGRLKSYIYGAVNQGAQDDGLLQRFQLAVYPDENEETWINVDRPPNKEADEAFHKVFENLYSLSNENQVVLRFSTEAQETFDDWRTELENKIRDRDIHPSLESHLAKYRSLMPSIALVLQLAEDPNADKVSLDCALKAVYWCHFLESHAKRIYSMGIDMSLANANTIFERRNKLPSPFKSRHITDKKWIGLPDKKTVLEALEILIEHDYIVEEKIESISPGGGRPSTVYHWNPNI